MEHLDVIVVGAGISGISAAVHLGKACPDKSVAILERRENIGGTWDLFKYPGIRSDSDMHTLGFSFKPWKAEKSIADGPSIMQYLGETVDEYGLGEKIRCAHQVTAADWSSADARWVLSVEDNGVAKQMSANFLFMCSGYYSYDQPHDAQIAGIDDFAGAVVHPQFWPEDLDYAGKRVVVIGSGATAVTLVPSMAAKGAQVTMLQRSPTYMVARSDKDATANFLRRVLPERWAYNLTRMKNVRMQRRIYEGSRKAPAYVRKQLLDLVAQMLPEGYDVDKHFTPSYNPWDQRLCLVPNADLFRAIKKGTVEIVTDEIDTVTAQGIRLKSGEVLPADIVITATGLQMQILAGVPFTVDGEAVNFPDSYTYKGMMYSGVPNLVSTFGYIHASWTLRADLTSEWACRGLRTMAADGVDRVVPRLREEDKDMQAQPWIADFPAGYMKRAMHLFPKQGHGPWRNTQDFALDKKLLRKGPLLDGALVFSSSRDDATATLQELPAQSAG
ncbi:MAG: NAD(P)-binding domain-containing protein [Proteobacteria bacterium]|nr:NAD(P)-binding domain-containing protein [Pseudomonadota bacterium]